MEQFCNFYFIFNKRKEERKKQKNVDMNGRRRKIIRESGKEKGNN